jgi:alkylhydroperoxidase family enzyme
VIVMAFIGLISEESASPPAAALLEADRGRLGYVPNFGRAFTHRPALYEAWQRLSGALKQTMGARRYELVTLAAARRLQSSYCMLAHGKVLVDQLFDAPTVHDIATDHRSAGLARSTWR